MNNVGYELTPPSMEDFSSVPAPAEVREMMQNGILAPAQAPYMVIVLYITIGIAFAAIILAAIAISRKK